MKRRLCWLLSFCSVGGLLAGTVCPLPDGESAGHDTDARIAYYRARIGGPATYPAYARLALEYLRKARETGRGEYQAEGLRWARKSLSYQRSFEGLLGMALGLSETHHFPEALAYAQEALAALPGSTEALGVRFDIQLALGRVEHAEGTLNRMLEAGPGFAALTRQSALREYRGDLDGALAAMKRAVELVAGDSANTTRAWAEVRVGSLQMARGDAAGARRSYERAIRFFPEYHLAKEHLAEWHAAQGQWAEAGALFQQLIECCSKPEYLVALAEVCRRQGKLELAEQAEQKALADLRSAVREGAQDCLALLASLLVEHRNTAAEGLDLAKRDWSIRQDARTADTLAWAFWRNGQLEESLRLSAEALRSGTRNPAVLLHAGLIRCRSGQAAEGKRLLRQALACPLAFGLRERALAEQARLMLSEPSARSPNVEDGFCNGIPECCFTRARGFSDTSRSPASPD